MFTTCHWWYCGVCTHQGAKCFIHFPESVFPSKFGSSQMGMADIVESSVIGTPGANVHKQYFSPSHNCISFILTIVFLPVFPNISLQCWRRTGTPMLTNIEPGLVSYQWSFLSCGDRTSHGLCWLILYFVFKICIIRSMGIAPPYGLCWLILP